MSHTRKYQGSLRYGIFDICLGVLIIIFPLILMKNFLYAFCYMFLLSTFSSINVVNIAKRISPLAFSVSLISSEECKSEKTSRKIERKEFSLFKCAAALLCSILGYYVFSVLFGAPVFEYVIKIVAQLVMHKLMLVCTTVPPFIGIPIASFVLELCEAVTEAKGNEIYHYVSPAVGKMFYTSTLYFSSLMVLLTIYPLLWYFFFSDSIGAVIRVFLDIKCDNVSESHLHSFAVFTIIGAWIGAFPIPLDWDRPWQTWPITCCIGASLGYSVAHFVMGSKLLHTYFKEKKKLACNRLV